MFGIGMTELLVILVVALLVFGPTKLPELARSLGRAMHEFRRASNDLRASFNEAIEPAPAPQPELRRPAPAIPAPAPAAGPLDQPAAGAAPPPIERPASPGPAAERTDVAAEPSAGAEPSPSSAQPSSASAQSPSSSNG
jgi:TatA/E family protein of Tat protein translocase